MANQPAMGETPRSAAGRKSNVEAGGGFTIDLTRAGIVESRHRVHAVVSDRRGGVEWWGEAERPVIPRSAIKSIQAIPLVRTGAAAAHGVTRQELALACASHSGEEAQVDAVLSWLDRLGLTESELECGPDLPLGQAARRRWIAAGGAERPVLNCCSGKHTGFLTVARHLGVDTAGYIERRHPVQEQVTEAIATFAGVDLNGNGRDAVPTGIDGCGIPVFALPLQRLALAMARLVDPVDLSAGYAEAAATVVDAAQEAYWVSGSGRTEVEVVEAATEPVVIKTGAEGVFMAALPDRGLGIALKAEDGTSRASQAAIEALLRHLEALPPLPDGATGVPVTNKMGVPTGETRVVIGRSRHDSRRVLAC
jgi:L-asparaginase II